MPLSIPLIVPSARMAAPSTLGPESVGGTIYASSGVSTSGTWPVANTAILVPFFTVEPITVQGFWWVNGTVVSGNVDAAVVDMTGLVLGNAGSTPQAGTTSAGQSVTTITPFTIQPGDYFFALALDNTTGRIREYGPSSSFPQVHYRSLGIQEAASAFPLTGTLTLANPTHGRIPTVGITRWAAF